MSAPDRYYVTTPIYYVNDRPHIGHAYSTLACDVLARFMRLDGREVHFLTGTDEHGQKVEKSAQARGVDPQTFTDEVSENFRELARLMNFSNDDFIRTTEPRHYASCQALWEKLVEAGDIYLGSYSGWYAVRDEAFYGEDELTKDEEGRMIAPSGAECEWVEEPSYFFRLSAWQDRLLALYEERPDFILPETRRNEVVSFVRSGLRDLSVSRTTFGWGIPVPNDAAHVMYVWLDALTNYITAVGYPDENAETFRKFWPADLHMVGKDILRFHAVYWPAFLMAAGLEPPRRVFAHGWLLNKGAKMSKSLGNVLRPADLVERYGLDPVRYYLLREVPFGQDGYVSHESMVARINGDLANDLGNLAQRSLSMIAKNCGGAVPDPGALTEADRALLDKAAGLLQRLREEYGQQAFHRGLEAVWQVVGDANRYVDEQAPWALRKTDPARMATVLWVLAETVRRVAILVQPVMPQAMETMLDQLGVPADRRGFADLDAGLVAGTPLPKPQGVFPRYVEPEGEGEAAAS
ncbi:methionyl-tRNA synthetase [Tistlia consotensis]|uniref:Methionine--tRNA ligase n=1 Tax=Tistlia consotensis USBA 355 TaxID=560819 RepID=A0A1Y6CJB3_9PROT|nr:methionine--tRNA ligase [Tistlia consotensis]SMF68804.1 methionyl-tRNA synthetase [Tistlia consotensis USBA 355]SNS01398.1 methionyl-tRNA synthetase [Tistlia consotensis]